MSELRQRLRDQKTTRVPEGTGGAKGGYTGLLRKLSERATGGRTAENIQPRTNRRMMCDVIGQKHWMRCAYGKNQPVYTIGSRSCNMLDESPVHTCPAFAIHFADKGLLPTLSPETGQLRDPTICSAGVTKVHSPKNRLFGQLDIHK